MIASSVHHADNAGRNDTLKWSIDEVSQLVNRTLVPAIELSPYGTLKEFQCRTPVLASSINTIIIQAWRQWSTGLGFYGPAKKACPAHGLSMGLDKPIAKCGNYERGSSGSLILVDYI
jgi:hypothetical protein